MSFYEDLVMAAQGNYSRYFPIYRQGGTPVQLTNKKPLPYAKQLEEFQKLIDDAECIIIGGASGLSAAGGGDFYYEDNDSFKKCFGRYEKKYGFKGAFAGTFYQGWPSREEFWGYMATLLHTTQMAPARQPYLDLDKLIRGKDFFVVTTNQDTQFLRLYPENKVAEIQGDHRFFQCSVCCTDDTWDAVKPVEAMIQALGDDKTAVPKELVPHCPHCGAEAFPWVRGYGNFLQGTKYEAEYEKISRYILAQKDKKILFIELGVGRMTPMFIQEPFWGLTAALPQAHYVAVNRDYAFLPQQIEDKGLVIKGDIGQVLKDMAAKQTNAGSSQLSAASH